MAADNTNKPLQPSPAQTPGPLAPDSLYLRTGPFPAGFLPMGTEPAGGGAQGANFRSLLHSLRRRWLLALVVACVAAVGAVAGVFFLLPLQYAAEFRFLIAARTEASLFSSTGSVDPDFAIVKANQAALVKSPLVLSAALQRRDTAGKEVRDFGIVRNRPSPVDWLESALKTDFLLGPEILRVTLAAENAEELAGLLNAIAQACLEENQQRDRGIRQQRIDQLVENQRELEDEIRQKRLQLQTRIRSLGVEDKDIRAQRWQSSLARLAVAENNVTQNRLDQIKAQEELRGLERRLENIDGVPVPETQLDDTLRTDFRAQGLFLQLEKIEKDVQQYRQVLPAASLQSYLAKEEAKRKEVLARVQELKKTLLPELEQRWRQKEEDTLRLSIFGHKDKLATLAKQETLLQEEAKKIRDEVATLSPAGQSLPIDIQNLQEKVGNMQAALDKVSQTIVTLRAEPFKPRVTLLQSAVPPQKKDAGRQFKFAAAGAFLLFFLGLAGVAFWEMRARRIGSPDEVARDAGLNLMGTLPPRPRRAGADPAKATGRQAYFQNQLGEAVDSLRTQLLHLARTDNLRVLLVTSAVGGEGKTSLASQLAASLARAWRKTLLIDGDLRNPATHQLFGLPQEPGFSEVLRGEIKAADSIKPTPQSRLWLLPAGHWDQHAVQALAQDNLRTLFEQLKQQYDFIVVDSCPILPVADTLQLAQHTDGVLFSVLRDVSRIPTVQAAHQKLMALGVRTLGAVVLGAKGEGASLGESYLAAPAAGS